MHQGVLRRDPRPDFAPPAPAAFSAILDYDARRRDVAGRRLLRLVAVARNVSTRQLLSSSRGEADVAQARQLAMYLMHVALGRLYRDVGRFFGRDRTTVAHACSLIEDMRDDDEFDAEVTRLERRLVMRREGRNGRA